MTSVELLSRLDREELDVLDAGVRRDRDDPGWSRERLEMVEAARGRLLDRIAAARLA